MPDEEVKTPRQRVVAAIDAALVDHVQTIFRALVGNMIEARARAGTMTEESALGMFSRGMKVGLDAYTAARRAVDGMKDLDG